MLPLAALLMLSAIAFAEDGHVVQFIIHTLQESEISRLFPGADVQFTWNDIYIVRTWTHDPQSVIPEIQNILDQNTNTIQVIIPPLSLAAATEKWIEYNLVWALLIAMVFVAGCACGAVIVNQCMNIKRATQGINGCRTAF